MKKPLYLLLILIILSACTIGSDAENPPPPTATAIVQPEQPAPTNTLVPPTPVPPTDVPPTEVPPTPIPPTATPFIPQISIETIGNLTFLQNFGQGNTPRSLVFSPDNKFIASAGGNTEDFDIRVWDLSNGSLQGTLAGHTNIVWAVAFSPDGQYLASVSTDGTGKIWDWANGSLVESLDFPSSVNSVTFSPDGQTVAFGGVVEFPDAAIWTFSVPSWQPEMQLAEFWNIPAIVFSPNGDYIVGGGTSRNARIWQASNGDALSIMYHSGQVTSLAISPDGDTIAAGLCATAGDAGTCAAGEVWLWALPAGTLNEKITGIPDWVENISYSLDGSLMFVGARSGRLSVYSTSNSQLILNTGSPGGNGLFALSPDGRLLATSRRDGMIDLWGVAP